MSLSGLHIVLMRPRDQATVWQQQIIAEKAEVTLLPMIDIIPVPVEASMFDLLSTAEQVIVTSQNAVHCAPAALIEILIKRKIPVFSIGRSTTKSLIASGINEVYEQIGNQSEDFLKAPTFQASHVKGKKIVLLVGKGGRALIAQTLSARGAEIYSLTVYAQQPIRYTLDLWFERWQGSQKQVCFLVTSGNILHNFESQIPNKNKIWLHEQYCVVISQRLEALTKEYGFQHIINANSAYWPSVLMRLQEIAKVCHTRKHLST